jgi:hypothetical protein
MSYTITAMSLEGAVSFRSKTPAEALKTAVELMALGLEGVNIADAKGHQYTPTDFGRAYVDNGDANA